MPTCSCSSAAIRAVARCSCMPDRMLVTCHLSVLVGSGLLGGSVGRRLGGQLAGFVFSGMSLGFISNPNSRP